MNTFATMATPIARFDQVSTQPSIGGSNKVAPVSKHAHPLGAAEESAEVAGAKYNRYLSEDAGNSQGGTPGCCFGPRHKVRVWLDWWKVEMGFGVVVSVYCLLIFVDLGLQVDTDNVKVDSTDYQIWCQWNRFFTPADLAFLIFFGLEIALRMFAFGILYPAQAQGGKCKLEGYLGNPINLIDAAVVVVSLVMTLVGWDAEQLQCDRTITSSQESSIAQTLRLIRLLRVVMVMNKIGRARDALKKMQFLTLMDSVESPVIKVLELLRNFQEKASDGIDKENLQWMITIISSEKLYQPELAGDSESTRAQGLGFNDWNQLTGNTGNVQQASSPPVKEPARKSKLMSSQESAAKQESLDRLGLRSLGATKEARLLEVLAKCDNWDLDVFELTELAMGQPLFALGFHLFERFGLTERLGIKLENLAKFLRTVESGYIPSNTYHNNIHAADVLQAFHHFITIDKVHSFCNDLDRFSGYIACIVHDYQHPGCNNAFLSTVGADVAMIYNDHAVLEMHHIAAAFKLLNQPHMNILKGLDKQDYTYCRGNMISMVLGTDMSMHFESLASFKAKGIVDGYGADEAKDRQFILKMALHTADISNLARPQSLAVRWGWRVVQEFVDQGDKERELGLPVGGMNDRNTAQVSKTNLGFLKIFVKPLYEAWSQWIGEPFDDILKNLTDNQTAWEEKGDDLVLEVTGKPAVWPEVKAPNPNSPTIVGFTNLTIPLDSFPTFTPFLSSTSRMFEFSNHSR